MLSKKIGIYTVLNLKTRVLFKLNTHLGFEISSIDNSKSNVTIELYRYKNSISNDKEKKKTKFDIGLC